MNDDDVVMLTCRPERALQFSMEILEGMKDQLAEEDSEKNRFLVHMQSNVVQLLKFAVNHMTTFPAAPPIIPNKIKS